MSGNGVPVYILAYLGSTVLAGVGVYLLTRSPWGRRDAAWLGSARRNRAVSCVFG